MVLLHWLEFNFLWRWLQCGQYTSKQPQPVWIAIRLMLPRYVWAESKLCVRINVSIKHIPSMYALMFDVYTGYRNVLMLWIRSFPTVRVLVRFVLELFAFQNSRYLFPVLMFDYAGRLEGMWYEAKGSWQKAEKLYSNLLTENPSDTVSARLTPSISCERTILLVGQFYFSWMLCGLQFHVLLLAGCTQTKDCHG